MNTPNTSPEAQLEMPVTAVDATWSDTRRKLGNVIGGIVEINMDTAAFGVKTGAYVTGKTINAIGQTGRAFVEGIKNNPFPLAS